MSTTRPNDRDERLAPTNRTSITQYLARVSAVHPWRVVTAWGLILAASVVAIGTLLGSAFTSDGSITTNPDSARAEQVIADNFSQADRIDDAVVIYSPDLTSDDPKFKAFVSNVRSSIEATGATQTVRDPYAADRSGISEDGHAAVVTLVLGDDPENGIIEVIDEVVAADSASGFEVDITGVNTLDHDFTELSESDLTNGELKFGLPAAMIVLVLVFGALVAAFIPMSIAILSIIVTVAISSVLGQVTSLSFFIVNMITAMGLALGIDYSLFVLSRYREERQAGRDKIDAIIATGGTSSKAVLFSGSSFVVALLGLLLVPDTILRSLALGAIIVGVVTMAAAITLLPALLSLLGDRVNALRLPIVGRDHPAESPFWKKSVGAVVRRPGAFLAAGVLVLLAAAFPVLGLQTGTAGVNSLPDDSFAKAGALALERSFPGTTTTDPAQVVVSGDVGSSDVSAAIARFETSVADDPDFGPAQQQIAENGQVAVISIPLVGDPDHSQARRGLDRLRTDLVPAAFDGTDTTCAGGWHHGGERRLLRRHQQVAADRARLRPGAELHPAHARLPLCGRLRHRGGAQPALGRGGLRTARAGVPARRGSGPAGLPAGRARRSLGAGLPVLGAVRALDGLPRVPAQQDPGALRADRRHQPVRRARHRLHRPHHHRRRADHRRGLRRLRGRSAGHVPADGLRRRHRPPGGRNAHPDDRGARRDGPPRPHGTGTCPAG